MVIQSPFNCVQGEVLPLPLVDELKSSIATLPDESFFNEPKYRRRGLLKSQPMSHRYENPQDSWFPVSFGRDASVTKEDVTLQYAEHKNYATMQKAVCVALQWMAEQMSWQGQTKQMAMSIMQHHQLRKGQETAEIVWHRDASDTTLVILLDNENNWSGGDFLFRVGQGTPVGFQPKRGHGVLFSNDGTTHCLKPFTAIREGIDRTILTIHEKSMFPSTKCLEQPAIPSSSHASLFDCTIA